MGKEDYERLVFCKEFMRREEIILEWIDDLVEEGDLTRELFELEGLDDGA